MELKSLFPYYHPTTVFFIDDQKSFLQGLAYSLSDQLAYRFYDSATIALEDLLRMKYSPAIKQSELKAILYNPQRFNQSSVIILDYDMPDMTGLDLCKKLKDYPFKKMLLTGVADEKIAVDAFNNGLIDRFLVKNSLNVLNYLEQVILELQYSYFADHTNQLMSNLSHEGRDFLHDRIFRDYFESLQTEHNFIEYYLTEQPNGFVLLDQAGNISRLFILTADDLDTHYDIAMDQQAPQILLDQLKSGAVVPHFYYTRDNHYEPNDQILWESCLHPATVITGDLSTYYCSLLQDTAYSIDLLIDQNVTDKPMPYSTYLYTTKHKLPF